MLIHTCLSCQEVESAQRLKVSKMSLEVTSEKLEAELEAANQRLQEALSRPAMEVADRKAGRASVVTRSALALHTSDGEVKLNGRLSPHRCPSVTMVTASVNQSNLAILFSRCSFSCRLVQSLNQHELFEFFSACNQRICRDCGGYFGGLNYPTARPVK